MQEERRIVLGRRTGREGEDRTSLFLREEEGFQRVRSIVFCSVKRQTRLLHEGDRGEKEKDERRDETTSFYWGGCESGKTGRRVHFELDIYRVFG